MSGSSKQPELLPALVDSAIPDIEDISCHDEAEKSPGKCSYSLSCFAASDESEMPAQAVYCFFHSRSHLKTRQRRARIAQCPRLNQLDAAIPTLKSTSRGGRQMGTYRGYYGKHYKVLLEKKKPAIAANGQY